MAVKELYDLGEMPPLGEVPEKMHAFLVRQDRFCLLYTSPSPRDRG